VFPLAREKRANYYIIKPYLQQKTFLILTQPCGETASCINENLIKADWLNNYVDIKDLPNTSLAESDSDKVWCYV
jgi:hypothetical protein